MSLKAFWPMFTLLGLIAEIVLLVVLIARRQYKVFPVFTLYIGFGLVYDLGIGALMIASPPFGAIPRVWIIAAAISD